MKDLKGFLNIQRTDCEYRPACDRVLDYAEVFKLPEEAKVLRQAERCMDCGTPFCHAACPVGNYIPEWNDCVSQGQWQKAFELLALTNPLPEITGRVCPALCEYACVAGINCQPVSVRENELSIIEYAFRNNFVRSKVPPVRTGKKVAVVGSGPAGLAAANRLNQLGHQVTVFERDPKIGGLMRYGIPDFKLDKAILDRRLKLLAAEGIEFKPGVDVGSNYPTDKLSKEFDAVCVAIGARTPRDLKLPGRELKGIYFAMDYLTQANRIVSGEKITDGSFIDANGLRVVVIGGGDTGSDCVGYANRQKAKSITQIEVLPKPSPDRSEKYPWPMYPVIFKNSSSHLEGCERFWSIATKSFIGNGAAQNMAAVSRVTGLACVRLNPDMTEVPNSAFEIAADLVILAAGFLRPDPLEWYKGKPGFFEAGDVRCGPSLVVWAINEGIETANKINAYLQ